MVNFDIYGAGAMGSFGKDNFEKGNGWRVYLKNKLESLDCRFKVFFTNPNNYYNFLDKSTYDSELEIMKFDIGRVKRSDLVVVNFNDIASLGTMAEIAIAYDRRIPIIGLCENDEYRKIHPWQKEMCDKIFLNRDALVDYIEDYYLN